MKTADKKREFIALRAEGKSYRAIQSEIGVSRSTCGAWEQELRAEVMRRQQDNLEELYTAYGMAREARIRRIGDTLRRIDDALTDVDLTQLSPEKLLDYKLKYCEALKAEYAAPVVAEATGKREDNLTAIQDLYRRAASGDTSTAQAKAELTILDQMAVTHDKADVDSFFMT